MKLLGCGLAKNGYYCTHTGCAAYGCRDIMKSYFNGIIRDYGEIVEGKWMTCSWRGEVGLNGWLEFIDLRLTRNCTLTICAFEFGAGWYKIIYKFLFLEYFGVKYYNFFWTILIEFVKLNHWIELTMDLDRSEPPSKHLMYLKRI